MAQESVILKDEAEANSYIRSFSLHQAYCDNVRNTIVQHYFNEMEGGDMLLIHYGKFSHEFLYAELILTA